MGRTEATGARKVERRGLGRSLGGRKLTRAGDAEGLGETRKKELVKSALALGVRSESDIWVVDRPYVPHIPIPRLPSPTLTPPNRDDFPDSMTTPWPQQKIAALLLQAFSPPHLRPTAAIDVLITFDHTGVSSHPNHTSLYHGARAFLSELVRGRPGHACPVDLYTLRSVSALRKYLSVCDMPLTMVTAFFRAVWGRRGGREHPGSLLFVNQLVGGGALGSAWGAMVGAHKSQMVWFRWLWIVFSRYMVMNDLQLEKVR